MSKSTTRNAAGSPADDADDAAGAADTVDTDGAETPTYEAAREELIEVVRTLEAGGTTLEESLALWERGERLAQVCQSWLDGARTRLDAVIEGESD
jgi:exodeoxyribonuclease VII small subunit